MGLDLVLRQTYNLTRLEPDAAWSSLACLPDDPRKMRGLFMRDA
jgi:hypothetical protein